MLIRNYKPSDCVEITDLFHGSVHAVDLAFYTERELEAWAPTPPDYKQWKQRLELRKPFVAVQNGMIIGFIELENNGHIDCMYVHKDHQCKGIGGKLLQHVYRVAKSKGIKSLSVEASKVAKPFFDKLGFMLVEENTVVLKEQSLINFKMVYKLPS